MAKQVVSLTKMDKMPENCEECDNPQCSLPTMPWYPVLVKKSYKTKRHPSCPLRLVDPENLHGV